MKKQILNLGIPATHDLISVLGNPGERLSISDFDAFVFEPQSFRGLECS